MILFFPQIKLPFIVLDGHHIIMLKAKDYNFSFSFRKSKQKYSRNPQLSQHGIEGYVRHKVGEFDPVSVGFGDAQVSIYFCFALKIKHTKIIVLLLVLDKILIDHELWFFCFCSSFTFCFYFCQYAFLNSTETQVLNISQPPLRTKNKWKSII